MTEQRHMYRVRTAVQRLLVRLCFDENDDDAPPAPANMPRGGNAGACPPARARRSRFGQVWAMVQVEDELKRGGKLPVNHAASLLLVQQQALPVMLLPTNRAVEGSVTLPIT